MFKSKVLQLFQTLDTASRRQLYQLIQSKHTCSHTAIQRFWDYFLEKKYLSARNTTKAKVYAHCFPAQVYDDAKLRRLSSNALSFLEENIRYFEKKETAIDTKIHQLDYYRQHDLIIFGKALFKNLEQELAALPYRDEQYYLKRYLMGVEKFAWEGQDRRLAGNNLQQLTQDLHYFYTIATLKYACISLTHQNLRQANYHIPLLQSTLAQIETEPAAVPPAVQLYYHAFLALQNGAQAQQHFQALKQLLLEASPTSIVQDPKEVLLLAINYCIKQINSGDDVYIRETFELYLFGLKQHILVQTNGFLSRHTFKNIIAVGLRLCEFEWVEHFIRSASQWLETPYVTAQVEYNTAKLYMSQQNFEPAIRLLQQVDFDDIFMNMDAKVMLLNM